MHSARAAPALRQLAEQDPALAALALWCRHRDADALEGAARSDGETILYGPAFEALGRPEQVATAAHHILHVAFRHATRADDMAAREGGGFHRALYNLAADAIVNQALFLAGYVLPRPAPELSPLLAEALGLEHGPEEALALFDADSLYVRLRHGPEARTSRARALARTGSRGGAAGDGGGGGGDDPESRARTYGEQAGFAEDLEAGAGGGASGEVRSQGEADWRQRLARAMQAGRAAGRGFGLLGHRLADLPRSRTPWEILLRGLVTRAVTRAPAPSWRRPSRRWCAMEAQARATGGPVPVYEPGTRREAAEPRIVVGLDASGSIDDALLARLAGEIAGIGRRSGAEVHLLVFDERVRLRRKLAPGFAEREIAALSLPRGGGTDFREVLAEAAALAPSVIVMQTDLEGPLGPPPGRIPVIWAVPGETPPSPPPFGRVLSLAR